MKKINFIDTLSAQEQKKLQRWYISFAVCLTFTLCCIAFVQTKQLIRYTRTTKQKNSVQIKLTQLTKNIDQPLQTKEKKLRSLVRTINKCKDCPENPVPCVACIQTACDAHELQSITIAQQKVTLTSKCKDADQSLCLLNQLQQSKQFKNLELVSLQPEADGILCTIKGNRT